MKRRDALLGIGAGAAALFARVAPFRWPNALLDTTDTFEPDVDMRLVAAPAEVQILPGARTRV